MQNVQQLSTIFILVPIFVQESFGSPKSGASIVAAKEFNAERQAVLLHKAMDGLGTDEASIIHIATTHNLVQRQSISNKYKTLYVKDLLQELKSELTGDFETFIVGLFQEPPNLLATELYTAMKGFGTNEDTLTEILCSRSSQEIQMIAKAYKSLYGTTLEKQINSETSGNYKKLLLALIKNTRSTVTKQQDAGPAAAKLVKAGKKFLGIDTATFIKVFSESSFDLLKSIASEYVKKTRQPLKDFIAKKMSGDLKNALLTILHWSEDPIAFYTLRLQNALDRTFADKKTVIRIILLRAEVDLADIITKYQSLFHKSLHTVISAKLGGDLKKGVLAILDGNRT